MELKWVEEFVSIMETNSFQESADIMNVSQSSLSKHIKNLEDELGVSLFDRSTRSVKPSVFGDAYYPIAKDIVRLCRDGSQTIQSIQAEIKNEISVAFTPTMGQYGVIETLTDFSDKYPNYTFKFVETPNVVKLLKNGQCELGFLPEDSEIDDKLQKMIYRTDRLVALIYRDSPLAACGQISVQQICESQGRLILHYTTMDKPYLATKKFLEMCVPYDLNEKRIIKMSNIATIMKMVEKYRGISVLAENSVPSDAPHNIAVVPIEPAVLVCFYAIYRTQQHPAVGISNLLQSIRQCNVLVQD